MKWKILIAFLIISGGIGVYSMTRGLRNNNPGNIRKTKDKWQGLSKIQTDSDFFQFEKSIFGIRAMAKLLQNYQIRSGLNTIREIVSKWAPSNENNTESYINSVSRSMGVGADDSLLLSFSGFNPTLRELTKAIIKHENGLNPYSDELIEEAIDLI